MQETHFNQMIGSVRSAVLHAGAQSSLRWWNGSVLGAEVLKVLFPSYGETAGLNLLEQTVRRLGSEERSEGYTLFDFTEEHEVVLRQQLDRPLQILEVPVFSSGRELSAWLIRQFQLPVVQGGRWTLSTVNKHATQPDPENTDRSSNANLRRLSLLISGLSHSEAGAFLQPVLLSSKAVTV